MNEDYSILPEPSSIRGIIFDLDGTLYRMRWFMKPLLGTRLFPHSMRLFRFMTVRQRFAGTDMGSRDILLDRISSEMGGEVKTKQAAHLRWIHESFYPAFTSLIPLFRGSRPQLPNMLSSLKQCGVRCAVLSDYSCVEQRLAALAIPAVHFDICASSEDTGALKPCCRPARSIVDTWELPVSSVLFVGDREDTDGELARRMGMPFLRISDKRPTPPSALSWKILRDFLETVTKMESA